MDGRVKERGEREKGRIIARGAGRDGQKKQVKVRAGGGSQG